jgi:peptide/nickel transport system substrate-binding protein
MDEQDLRKMIGKVKSGRMSRRRFVQAMLGAGLTVPMAGTLLMHAGVANAQSKFTYKPTKPGGGTVKLLMWQAPTLLNPHFATGTKDQYAARVFYEPLAGWDADGNLIANLAAEIPSLQNGGVAKDGLSVTWKLKKNVTFHDGHPFTADDVVFNWEYAADPATAATTIGRYKDVKVEKIDTHTVKVVFDKPTPFWANAFVGVGGMILPKHLFQEYKGAKSRDAPANLKPVGTGCYKFVDFKPGDILTGTANKNYHEANRPFFDAIEIKGGGDATSAARAVLQTGEYDYAWNMQVSDDVLKRLEAGGKGKVSISPAGGLELIQLNYTDPVAEVDGERSSAKTKHFAFTDMAVRRAMNLLVDRKSIQDHIYGRTGIATRNFLNNPAPLRSKNQKWEYDIAKANKLLDDAGWKKGSDGIREKNGKKMKFVFQTSINDPRQKCQQVIKQACQKAGIELELKSVPASVYFSSDVANPDVYSKLYADMQMYNTTMTEPDPEVFINQFASWEMSSKENKWQGRGIARYSNPDFDKLYKAAQNELDPVKRTALFVQMNDLLIDTVACIPLVNRPVVRAVGNKLRAPFTGWDSDVFLLKDWYREA